MSCSVNSYVLKLCIVMSDCCLRSALLRMAEEGAAVVVTRVASSVEEDGRIVAEARQLSLARLLGCDLWCRARFRFGGGAFGLVVGGV